MKRFETGKTYWTRSICDHDCIYRFTISKRTEKTVWIKYHGKTTARRVRTDYDGNEAIDPHGRYSMSPVLSAAKVEA